MEVETTRRKVVQEGNPQIRHLLKALADSDVMDLNTYIKCAYENGADQIWAHRVVNGEEMKVATLTPDTSTGEDIETYVLNNYGGPGTFLFKPAVRSSYGGFMWARGRDKRVKVGVANEQDGGMFTGYGTDIDSRMSRLLGREEKMHALHQIQDLNVKWEDRRTKKPEEDDDVKSADLVALITKSNEQMMALVMKQHDLEIARINATAAAQKSPLDLLVPAVAPILGFLDKKLTPGTVTKWLSAFRDNPAPDEGSGFWSMATAVAKEAMPYVQPFFANVIQQMQQPAQPARGNRPPVVPAQPLRLVKPQPQSTETETEEEKMQRAYDDKDTKDVLDYAIECIDAGNYADAFASLRTCEDTMDAIGKIMPGSSPQSYFFTIRELDPRLRDRKDAVCNFIEYVQKCIVTYQEQLAAAAAKKVEEDPDSAPPAA